MDNSNMTHDFHEVQQDLAHVKHKLENLEARLDALDANLGELIHVGMQNMQKASNARFDALSEKMHLLFGDMDENLERAIDADSR